MGIQASQRHPRTFHPLSPYHQHTTAYHPFIHTKLPSVPPELQPIPIIPSSHPHTASLNPGPILQSCRIPPFHFTHSKLHRSLAQTFGTCTFPSPSSTCSDLQHLHISFYLMSVWFNVQTMAVTSNEQRYCILFSPHNQISLRYTSCCSISLHYPPCATWSLSKDNPTNGFVCTRGRIDPHSLP